MQDYLSGFDKYRDMLSRKLSVVVDAEVFYVNGIPVRMVTLEGHFFFVCADILDACGYITTGVASQFNGYPSYCLVKLFGHQRPVAIVRNVHIADWLKRKSEIFIACGNDTAVALLDRFLSDKLNEESQADFVDSAERSGSVVSDAIIPCENVPVVPESDVDRCLDTVFGSFLTVLHNMKHHITRRKECYTAHIAEIKSVLSEIEFLT